MDCEPVDEIIIVCFIEWNNMKWVEITFGQFDNSTGSEVLMLEYQSYHWKMHDFIVDVRKGGDLLKYFEQRLDD